MALDTERILKQIEETGFFMHEDTSIGEKVVEIIDYQPFSEEGLEFLAERAIRQKAVSKVINTIFKKKSVVCWYKYNRDKKPIFCWLPPQTPGIRKIHGLSLQWHRTGSKARFWLGSHLKQLKYHEEEEFGIPEVVKESLDQEGIREEVVNFPNGGFTIYDSRMAFQLSNGGALDAGILEPGIATWKMQWREGMHEEQKARIKAKIAEIETDTIKFLE